MGHNRNKLTVIALEKRRAPGRMGDGGGLYLNIKRSGHKSWVFRWTPKGGRPREMGLGGYPDTTLRMARDEALMCRQDAAAGVDPRTGRDRRRNRGTDQKTAGEVMDLFLESMSGRWSNDKSGEQWRRTFEVTCGPFRDRPVREIDTHDILQVLTPIWSKTPETAARTTETLGARWDEIDFDDAIWTVPAWRMKLRVEHQVPLSLPAMDILRPLHEVRISDFIFPGQEHGKALSNMTMEMVLRRMKVDRYTVHGFRSSFRDWCGDETTAPREVAEAALAHKVGGDVELAYRRGDALVKRRQLMGMWGDYCTGRQMENDVGVTAVRSSGLTQMP